MADPGVQAGLQVISGAALPFRFETTWRSLTRPLEPTRASSVLKTLNLPAVHPPLRQAPPRELEPREWEMVLPRTKPAPRPDLPLSPPGFALAPERTLGRWIALGGVLLIAAVSAGVYWNGQGADSGTAAPIEMGGAGWISEWASDPSGSTRGRQLSLYRPSMTMSDYRMEFSGSIERKSLGWVFRAADTRNYYVAKLEWTGAGSPLTVTRFAVVKGLEGPHFQRVLAHMPVALRVRQEARGAKFTIFVQNQIVEDWLDDRLKIGGLGFLNEREERGQVGSIQISFLRGVGQ